MSRVEAQPEVQRQLGRLMATRDLPPDTPVRVARAMGVLAAHPRLGKALRGTHAEYRYLRGPWKWLAIVYRYDAVSDVVVVVAVQDTRTEESWTHER